MKSFFLTSFAIFLSVSSTIQTCKIIQNNDVAWFLFFVAFFIRRFELCQIFIYNIERAHYSCFNLHCIECRWELYLRFFFSCFMPCLTKLYLGLPKSIWCFMWYNAFRESTGTIELARSSFTTMVTENRTDNCNLLRLKTMFKFGPCVILGVWVKQEKRSFAISFRFCLWVQYSFESNEKLLSLRVSKFSWQYTYADFAVIFSYVLTTADL